MTKENLIEQLEGVKSVTSTVDIDKMIKLIELIEPPKATTLSSEMVEEISNRIESCLDHNNEDLVDKDQVTFDISYGNQLEVEDVYVDVYKIMQHVTAILEEFENEDEVNNIESTLS
jgi:RNA binding exosome subunit